MKANLQLFGGRGGGSGLSGGGGQYGDRNSAEAQQYRRDLAELANANMSNSDLQAAVEAYAMTHKGIDEETMLRNVREYQDFADNPNGLSPQMREYLNEAGLNMKETKPARNSMKVPSEIRDSTMSTTKLREAVNKAGYERADEDTLKKGTKVIISEPIMEHSISSRRDPDGVRFREATYVGRSTGAFKTPIVELSNGQRRMIDTDMPYEKIYQPKQRRR